MIFFCVQVRTRSPYMAYSEWNVSECIETANLVLPSGNATTAEADIRKSYQLHGCMDTLKEFV